MQSRGSGGKIIGPQGSRTVGEAREAATADNKVYRRYLAAQKRVQREEGRELTPKEFMDTVDPKGSRSERSARDYMTRAKRGARSGKTIEKRASAASGRIVNVPLYDKDGNIVDSANIEIPRDASLLDIYRGRGLRASINSYMRHRKISRQQAPNEWNATPTARTSAAGLSPYNPKTGGTAIHIIKDRGRATKRFILRTRNV